MQRWPRSVLRRPWRPAALRSARAAPAAKPQKHSEPGAVAAVVPHHTQSRGKFARHETVQLLHKHLQTQPKLDRSDDLLWGMHIYEPYMGASGEERSQSESWLPQASEGQQTLISTPAAARRLRRWPPAAAAAPPALRRAPTTPLPPPCPPARLRCRGVVVFLVVCSVLVFATWVAHRPDMSPRLQLGALFRRTC